VSLAPILSRDRQGPYRCAFDVVRLKVVPGPGSPTVASAMSVAEDVGQRGAIGNVIAFHPCGG